MKDKKVTAFLDVFEEKVEKLVKRAVKIRKEEHGSRRDYAKKLINEARELRDYIETVREDLRK